MATKQGMQPLARAVHAGALGLIIAGGSLITASAQAAEQGAQHTRAYHVPAGDLSSSSPSSPARRRSPCPSSRAW